MHVSAVLKDSATYEHINPNSRRQPPARPAERSFGKGSILYKLKQHGLEDRLDDAARRELLDRIKQMEFQGYELEAAEGTFELLVREALRPGLQLFEVVSYEVTTKTSRLHCDRHAEGAGRRAFRDRQRQRSGERAGSCLRQCLSKLYPAIAERAADRL